MSDTPNDNKPSNPSGTTGEVILQSPGEVTIKHDDLPMKPIDDKKIHPRRPLPLVPETKPETRDDQPGDTSVEKP